MQVVWRPGPRSFFDSKKYLATSLQKYTTGFVLPLRFEEVNDDWDTGATEKDWFDAGHEINTLFKKLVEFYETSFNKICGGTIEFDGVDDWIFVKIEDGIDFSRAVYHIKEVDVYSFIEKLNSELNRIKPQRYGRPRDFGYYLINLENSDQKYIVCLHADTACDPHRHEWPVLVAIQAFLMMIQIVPKTQSLERLYTQPSLTLQHTTWHFL